MTEIEQLRAAIKSTDPKDYGPMWVVDGPLTKLSSMLFEAKADRHHRSRERAEKHAAKLNGRTPGHIVVPGVGGRAGWRAVEVTIERGHGRPMIFVGECRSLTAIRQGWTWKDGRLAAKPLFEALEAMGVNPADHDFVNLFHDPPANGRASTPKVNGETVARLIRASDAIRVALGKRVSDELAKRGLVHVALVHPAARGAIRKRERYIEHVTTTLRAARADRITP